MAPQRQTVAAPRHLTATQAGEVRGYALPQLVQRQWVPSQREQRELEVVMTPRHSTVRAIAQALNSPVLHTERARNYTPRCNNDYSRPRRCFGISPLPPREFSFRAIMRIEASSGPITS